MAAPSPAIIPRLFDHPHIPLRVVRNAHERSIPHDAHVAHGESDGIRTVSSRDDLVGHVPGGQMIADCRLDASGQILVQGHAFAQHHDIAFVVEEVGNSVAVGVPESFVSVGDAVVTTGAVLLRTEVMPGSVGAGCCEVPEP